MIFKKKALLLLSIVLTISLMVGCSSKNNDKDTGDNTSSGNVVESDNKGNSESSNQKKEHVLVTDIEFVGATIAEPDSIGTRYFKSQIKNNSKYKITGLNVELELDNGETSYFSMYDTLLPGDTSSISECFGATTGNLEDMKAKNISITMINDKEKYVYVDYDVKLDKYDIMEGDKAETLESPVLVSEIEFINPIMLEPDSIGTIYFQTQIKNNSKNAIKGFSVDIELDNGETVYLSTYDTLLPGDTSTKFECFGATTGNMEDMKAKKISIVALDEDKNEIYIDYDVKLDQYDVVESYN